MANSLGNIVEVRPALLSEQFIWLIPLGFVIGAYGTFIGAGGGFVLMPVLLLLYPNESPETLVTISLTVVLFNALSGSIAYARCRRVDYRAGLLFAAATIPGAVLGALTTSLVPRPAFDILFAALIIAISLLLLLRPTPVNTVRTEIPWYYVRRELGDVTGVTHAYSYNPITGVLLSLVVGFLSSLLGIGGGIIHVPALVQLLYFPPHIATATSHFILTFTAASGVLTHVIAGTFSDSLWRTMYLAVGVIAGAQFGAMLSNKVQDVWIMRALAITLLLVGVRLLVNAL